MTPSLCGAKWDNLKHLSESRLLLGGEGLSVGLFDKLLKERVEFINCYGPTEATIWSVSKLYGRDQKGQLSIGSALPNQQSYILDQDLNPLPIGAVGELYLGGAGISRGYLNRPELTAERFISNPFASEEDKEKGYTRLYKTGDLVRWLPDGNIEYIGRNDFQVKIRGFRIELGEIEHALSRHPEINQCAVISHMREGAGSNLVAYYVSEASIEDANLHAYMNEHLPDYMIPSVFIHLSELPLTTNGKLDRKALPEPQWIGKLYRAPRDELDVLLCGVWQKVLGLTQVGIDDDFYQLGGHSILAIQLAHQMSQVMQRQVVVADILNYKTISGLREHAGKALPEIAVVERADIPLSFAQARLWFIEQYEGGTDAYHIPMAFTLDAAVEVEALKSALQLVVKRHAVLRTVFAQDEAGQSWQRVREEALSIQDLLTTKATQEAVMRQLIHEPFDLTKEYPVRAVLLHMKNQASCLLLVFHHVAFDGWSQAVFLRDLQAYYQGDVLPELMVQYKDFSVWQREDLLQRTDELTTYWQDKLIGCEPLQFPTDYPRPHEVDYRGAYHQFVLSEGLSEQLRALAKQEGVTLYT
ncbi:MAG: condensation domain-containing protein, partial [Enhydrobacter sp.]